MAKLTICPICCQAMVSEDLHDAVFSRCASCCVFWFDESVFSKVVKELPVPDKAIEPTATLERLRELACPNCQTKIKPRKYSYQSGIETHKCETCNGLLLAEERLNEIVYFLRGPDHSRAIANFLLRDPATGWDRLGRCIKSKIVSSLFAALYLVVTIALGCDFEQVSSMATALIFPLAMICFSDDLGRLTRGRFGMFRPQITTATPGSMVALAGWILMLAVIFRVAVGSIYGTN